MQNNNLFGFNSSDEELKEMEAEYGPIIAVMPEELIADSLSNVTAEGNIALNGTAKYEDGTEQQFLFIVSLSDKQQPKTLHDTFQVLTNKKLENQTANSLKIDLTKFQDLHLYKDQQKSNSDITIFKDIPYPIGLEVLQNAIPHYLAQANPLWKKTQHRLFQAYGSEGYKTDKGFFKGDHLSFGAFTYDGKDESTTIYAFGCHSELEQFEQFKEIKRGQIFRVYSLKCNPSKDKNYMNIQGRTFLFHNKNLQKLHALDDA
jgi:hypothetical protein